LNHSAAGRDPALCDFSKCPHRVEYAALSKMPLALAGGVMLVLKNPDSEEDA
jgi:hypothetical protein